MSFLGPFCFMIAPYALASLKPCAGVIVRRRGDMVAVHAIMQPSAGRHGLLGPSLVILTYMPPCRSLATHTKTTPPAACLVLEASSI